MTVKEFAEDCECPIKVLSAYNNKVLCHDFNPDKHKEVGDRRVFKYWAEFKTKRNPGFGNYAVPIICIYVCGDVEYDEEHNKQNV